MVLFICTYFVVYILEHDSADRESLPMKDFIMANLKVPKREIFDSSDFPDFYTIESLRVGDFVVKIKKNFKNI